MQIHSFQFGVPMARCLFNTCGILSGIIDDNVVKENLLMGKEWIGFLTVQPISNNILLSFEKFEREDFMRRRNKNVAVRMTEDEYAAFMMKVAESGQTQQSFIINSVLGVKVSGREEVKELQKLSGQFADTNRQLRGMATNTNQMAHVANGYGQLPQQAQLEQLHQELQRFRKECDVNWRLIRQSISLQKVMEPCGTASNM